MADLELVDPKNNPYLRGRFAPIHREVDTRDIHVDGTLHHLEPASPTRQ